MHTPVPKPAETVTLTLDLQRAFRHQLTLRKQGFTDLSRELDDPAFTPQRLVSWYQRRDPVVLKEDWDKVVSTLMSMPVQTSRKQAPSEDRLLYAPVHPTRRQKARRQGGFAYEQQASA